eukprot:CAMPEP_0170070738 /NCGR_PEP_ID=MMETSP0019_2-20121128/8916_1 /TAXON_ID=98059 /ORGANISM="Dinobryon sp., Strain UTEXLB2267" /LENGTH=283 /DNA_ID=CAMNT_0010279089 /DNA_START=335 /DNA_END=1186 /DNA_ORIENTATION=+
MVAFANSAKAWLDLDPANVVNMHCKAGKGRAGLMCCVVLIRSGVVQSAKEALDRYDRERVTNNRGLTVTSQRKWVIFYEALWRQIWGITGNIGDVPAEPVDSTKYVIPPQPRRTLTAVELLNTTKGTVKNFRVKVYKLTNFLPELLYDSKVLKSDSSSTTSPNLSVECNEIVMLEGNFKITIEQLHGVFTGYKKILELLHNTLFMDRNAEYVDFAMDQLDVKKKMKAALGPQTILRLRFSSSSSSPSASPLAANNEEAAVGMSVGSRGYEMVARNENINLEMV